MVNVNGSARNMSLNMEQLWITSVYFSPLFSLSKIERNWPGATESPRLFHVSLKRSKCHSHRVISQRISTKVMSFISTKIANSTYLRHPDIGFEFRSCFDRPNRPMVANSQANTNNAIRMNNRTGTTSIVKIAICEHYTTDTKKDQIRPNQFS